MPTSLSFFDQWFMGGYADRQAINQNADELAAVEGQAQMLGALVQRQAQDILRMRAMFAGLVQVLEAKGLVAEDELQTAIATMWQQMDPHSPANAHRRTPVGMAMTKCIRCTNDVASSATTMTGDGPVCDSCVNRRG